MISFGLRWRLAHGASSVARQAAIGVLATGVALVLLPHDAHNPTSSQPLAKFTLRIEPDAQPATLDRPRIQQASDVIDVEPAAAAETHPAKPVVRKPKRMVAPLPPSRPREAPEVIAAAPDATAEAPAADFRWDWLAAPRAAVDVTASAFDTTKRWALTGKDWMSQTATRATAEASQVVHLGD